MSRSAVCPGADARQPGRDALCMAALAIVLLAAACTPTRPTLQPPSVTLENMRVTTLSDAEASVSLTLRVVNPNNVDLVARAIDFEVRLDGRPAANVHSVHIDPLPAGGEAKVELAGRVDVGAIASALMTLGSRVPVEYLVSGTATLGDGTVLPFAHKGEIPVARFDRALGARP